MGPTSEEQWVLPPKPEQVLWAPLLTPTFSLPPPDCSASNPAQELLRQNLRTSLLMAEKFSRRYDQLMRSYQQKMLSGSTMLKQLNQEFSWVSRLVNFTQGDDQELLKVTKVSRAVGGMCGETKVCVCGCSIV